MNRSGTRRAVAVTGMGVVSPNGIGHAGFHAAHGTSTPLNDIAEAVAIRDAFGGHDVVLAFEPAGSSA